MPAKQVFRLTCRLPSFSVSFELVFLIVPSGSPWKEMNLQPSASGSEQVVLREDSWMAHRQVCPTGQLS